MKLNLKALGLALVAVFAMSAVVASSAMATGEKFTTDKEHTILSAVTEGNQVFKTTVSTLECEEVSVDNATVALEGATTQITATPTYNKCFGVIAGSKLETRVTPTTCDYLFTSEVPAGKEHAEVHIECTTSGDEIDVEAFFLGAFRQCVKVPAQTPTGGGVVYTNSGTDHITINATVTGIKYTEVGICGSGTVVNDGTYTGKVTVSGKDTLGNTATLRYP